MNHTCATKLANRGKENKKMLKYKNNLDEFILRSIKFISYPNFPAKLGTSIRSKANIANYDDQTDVHPIFDEPVQGLNNPLALNVIRQASPRPSLVRDLSTKNQLGHQNPA
jgi:hypothetical protein